jgi:adenosylcobinamide-phosphate synthase
MPWLACTALLFALAIDWRWGEPPAAWHPVVWMGRFLSWVGRWTAPVAPLSLSMLQPDYKAFVLGALAWVTGSAITFAVFAGLELALRWGASCAPWAAAAAAVVMGLALKPLLAWTMLRSEVLAVEVALGVSLDAGRARLAWLVSRDVALLSEAEVRESALESLAENLNDSVVAPIFWFVLLGLPGAALYRFANTADAMWGYRGVRHGQVWEWAGKWAAWADDVLSWLPARLTALLLWVVSRGGVSAVALRTLRAQAALTPSPNSGWPMAAMALRLGVRLGKPGAYTLNASGRAPKVAETVLALVYAKNTVIALLFIALLAIQIIAIAKAGA